MKTYLDAFSNAKPYKGKTIGEWLAKWIGMPMQDLEKLNRPFLTVVTTWVIQKARERRKGGIPTGSLEKIAFPEDRKVNFVETLIAQVVLVLRRRGLVEADSQPTDSFRRFLDAFDRAPKAN